MEQHCRLTGLTSPAGRALNGAVGVVITEGAAGDDEARWVVSIDGEPGRKRIRRRCLQVWSPSGRPFLSFGVGVGRMHLRTSNFNAVLCDVSTGGLVHRTMLPGVSHESQARVPHCDRRPREELETELRHHLSHVCPAAAVLVAAVFLLLNARGIANELCAFDRQRAFGSACRSHA